MNVWEGVLLAIVAAADLVFLIHRHQMRSHGKRIDRMRRSLRFAVQRETAAKLPAGA